MSMAWLPDDLGPDFEQRWKQAPHTRRRELMAELRDLYMLLEDEDLPVLAGQAPVNDSAPAPRANGSAQGSLFPAGDNPAAAKPAARENPFLPRSVLARLQESQTQASAGLRDLMQQGQDRVGAQLAQALGNVGKPPTHEQVDLERELRLKLGPIVETLIEAQMDLIKRELRLRLRAEMDRLIAEHVRK